MQFLLVGCLIKPSELLEEGVGNGKKLALALHKVNVLLASLQQLSVEVFI